MAKKTSKRTSKRNVHSHKPPARGRRRTRVATPNGVLDMENGLGRMVSARAIAKSIKRAADAGTSLKKSSFEAAMAAVAYLIQHLEKQLVRLYDAQRELRRLYGQTEGEPQRRLRMISDERVAVRAQRKRSRKKIDLAASAG